MSSNSQSQKLKKYSNLKLNPQTIVSKSSQLQPKSEQNVNKMSVDPFPQDNSVD